MKETNKKEMELFQPTGNADLISFCPLLAQILSFLDYTDVFHCRLVNRRFYDVIKRNHQKMSHYCCDVTIVRATAVDSSDYYIMVNVSTIWKQVNMSVHIDGKGISVPFGRAHALYNAFPDPIHGLKIDSLEEGLQLVLEPLCYHFELNLELDKTVPADWYPIVSEVIRRNGTYLTGLTTANFPALGYHLKKIESIKINWSSNVFDCLPRMSHTFAYFLLPEPTETAQIEIFQLFVRWFSGEYYMPAIQFEELSRARWLFQLPPYLLDLYGPSCQHRLLPYDPDDESFYDNELFIRRPKDNVTLCIAYYKFRKTIYFYDTDVTEREFENLRFDYNFVDED